jgi:fumarylacetoacetase
MEHAHHPAIDSTHDQNLRSWVESANDPASDFPIQNLPLCTFEATHAGQDGHAHTHDHLGVAIGDSILDVSMLNEAGYFAREDEELAELLSYPHWAGLMFPSYGAAAKLRKAVQHFLNVTTHASQPVKRLREKALRKQSEVPPAMPVSVFNYTDFYASIHHASTVGAMFRPDNPLLPNYKHVPIGYHGRASSLVPSGTSIKRPFGQQSPPDDKPGAMPTFGPSKMLDYELEVGCVIAPGNKLGEPITIGDAHRHILGLCLVNDWSARDVQKWEYQPLGPFLAKNFATTVSPFLVTAEALAPFRCPAYARPEGDPKPLDYLADESDQAHGGFDITLEVYLQTADMLARGLAPHRLSSGRGFRDMYWTFAQMIAHHTSNGCNFQPGDLIASGTVSGPTADSRGCLLELTWDGTGKPRKPIELPTGEKRTFLADGDTIIMKAFCEREGFRRIGFGECRGTIRG